MKLLSVGDLHYNMPQFDWLMNSAGKYDLVIIAGDLLNIAGHVDLDTQILVINKYLARLRERTTLFVCSGNHDGDRKGESGEYFADWLDTSALGGIEGDGSSVQVGDWLFSLCPWWDGPVGLQAVTSFLEAEAAKAVKNWFIVHHAPPSESRIAWSGKRDFGDEHLRSFILKHSPRIVLSGHVHQAPFRDEGGWYDRIGDTWVFNAGYQMAQLPPYLEFNLGDSEVSWCSLEGIERITLNRSL